ncbi:MAG: hypothetical protein GXP33_13270 [Spirochaetes bacterium]|nr:hypothetical protein [Spirochaetota bacterium]
MHLKNYIILLFLFLLIFKGNAEAEKDESIVIIDNKEKLIKPVSVNYHEWTGILGEVCRLINKVLFDNRLIVELKWKGPDGYYLFSRPSQREQNKILEISIISVTSRKRLIKYTIVPWRNFTGDFINGKLKIPRIDDRLLTVTGYAVIFVSYPSLSLNPEEDTALKCFDKTFKNVIDYESSRTLIKDAGNTGLDIPSGIRIISCNVFKYYIDMEIAVSGSKLPGHSRWKTVSRSRMLRLTLIPDKGKIKRIWFMPEDPEIMEKYASFEKEIQNIFTGAVYTSINTPGERNRIYDEAVKRIRDLLNEENSKYETMLERWLLVFKTVSNRKAESRGQARGVSTKPVCKTLFSGYTPKLTPDSAEDFMPSIGEKIDNIPAALIINLQDLLDLFIKYQQHAEENPGHWESGNMILGAGEKEYIPSEDEILLSETGNRIRKIITSESKEEIKKLLKGKYDELRELKYMMFTFTHADVMGSGRFFYVNTIEKVKIDL